jgi:hypothetical protein
VFISAAINPDFGTCEDEFRSGVNDLSKLKSRFEFEHPRRSSAAQDGPAAELRGCLERDEGGPTGDYRLATFRQAGSGYQVGAKVVGVDDDGSRTGTAITL